MTNPAVIRRAPGPRATATLRCLLRGGALPRSANLRRTTPFTPTSGFERGAPFDRYDLHRFVSRHAGAITGRVLAVQTSSHTDAHE
jgi:hypothetical protein